MFKKLPSMLSFTRGIMITDATLDNLFDNDTTKPVFVERHGIAGTQNTATPSDNASMIQLTDSAKLNQTAKALRISFSLGFFDLKNSLHACSVKGKSVKEQKEKAAEVKLFLDSLFGFITRAQTGGATFDIACRYARNIANARWTWRNRTMANAVKVSVCVDGGTVIEFRDALRVPLHAFGDYSASELELASLINANLCGKADHRFHISSDLNFGLRGALEVYPSQNYLERKPRGFARSLYHIPCNTTPKAASPDDIAGIEGRRYLGHAAIRDQKVSNALRAFDTWFGEFSTHGQAISVEFNGANLGADTFFRDNKDSAFALAKHLDTLDPATNEGLFVIACLLRGGLLSEGEGKEA
jgi:CRISPR-associated protein Csy3